MSQSPSDISPDVAQASAVADASVTDGSAADGIASDGSKVAAKIAVGERVFVNTYKCEGVVKFVGETSFSSGQWVGVELDQPAGKIDGIVQGQRYFYCKARHGVFVRASALKTVASTNEASASASPPKASTEAPAASMQQDEDHLNSSNVDDSGDYSVGKTPPLRTLTRKDPNKAMAPPSSAIKGIPSSVAASSSAPVAEEPSSQVALAFDSPETKGTAESVVPKPSEQEPSAVPKTSKTTTANASTASQRTSRPLLSKATRASIVKEAPRATASAPAIARPVRSPKVEDPTAPEKKEEVKKPVAPVARTRPFAAVAASSVKKPVAKRVVSISPATAATVGAAPLNSDSVSSRPKTPPPSLPPRSAAAAAEANQVMESRIDALNLRMDRLESSMKNISDMIISSLERVNAASLSKQRSGELNVSEGSAFSDSPSKAESPIATTSTTDAAVTVAASTVVIPQAEGGELSELRSRLLEVAELARESQELLLMERQRHEAEVRELRASVEIESF